MNVQVRRLSLVALLAALLLAGRANALEPLEEQLRRRIEGLPGQALAQDVFVADGGIFTALYTANGFRPLWTRRATVDALVDLVRRADEEGLVPADYHAERLAALIEEMDRAPEPSAASRVDLDLLLTQSLLRYLYHRRFGKVDPVTLDSGWNFRRAIDDRATLARLKQAFTAEDLEGQVETIAPRRAYSRRLAAELARYRAMRARGGWAMLPRGPTLERGMSGERVRALRQRLIVSGHVEAPDPEVSELFDDELAHAVRAFQRQHGLDADGAVGRATLAALNVPVEARIDQLRVSMERARWVAQPPGDTYVSVNIAAATVELVRGDRTVWTTRAVVGGPYRKTPVFTSQLEYLVLNPTWTVPPTIMREDLLPALRADPAQLERLHMKVFDARERFVDAAAIDWVNLDVRAFPYQIRQDAGPGNTLGRVKFMLPNPYSVYLHDTPDRRLFDRSERAFSSGCIRVDDALELARLLLDDPERWSREAIDSVVAGRRTTTVMLRERMPVMLLYMTVEAPDDGPVRFLKDVYERDPAVLRALDGPFLFSPPEGFTELVTPTG